MPVMHYFLLLKMIVPVGLELDNYIVLFVCLFGFYSISTFVGYLKPNPF